MKIQILLIALLVASCASQSHKNSERRSLSSLEESCKTLMEKQIGIETTWKNCSLQSFRQNGKLLSKKKVKDFTIQAHKGFETEEGGTNFNMYYFCIPGAHCTTINVEQAPGYEASCTTDSVAVKTRHGATVGLGFLAGKFSMDYLEPEAELFLRLECKPNVKKQADGTSANSSVEAVRGFPMTFKNICLSKPVRRYGRTPLPWCFEKVNGSLFCEASEQKAMERHSKECGNGIQI